MLLDLRSLLESGATVAVEDSRGYFRRSGQAFPESLPAAIAAISRVTVSASAVVTLSGVRGSGSLGNVQARADAGSIIRPTFLGRGFAGQITASGSAAHAQLGVGRAEFRVNRRYAGDVRGDAISNVQGVRARVRVGRIGVEIGPDEVAAELEEILFLLEVA